jgi:hypothetical protein
MADHYGELKGEGNKAINAGKEKVNALKADAKHAMS